VVGKRRRNGRQGTNNPWRLICINSSGCDPGHSFGQDDPISPRSWIVPSSKLWCPHQGFLFGVGSGTDGYLLAWVARGLHPPWPLGGCK
jgi:hypothetical protein